jgi:hypothetical protein
MTMEDLIGKPAEAGLGAPARGFSRRAYAMPNIRLKKKPYLPAGIQWRFVGGTTHTGTKTQRKRKSHQKPLCLCVLVVNKAAKSSESFLVYVSLWLSHSNMPFFDTDSLEHTEAHGPLWGTFATLRDQLERLIALNIVWSVQLLPGLGGMAFPELPGWLRALLLAYSAVALAPATGALYGLAGLAAQGELITLERAGRMLRALALPSFRVLTPLYGSLGLLCWANAAVSMWRAGAANLLVLEVGLRLALLLALICAIYWGPLFAMDPDRAPAAIARRSVALVWRYPVQALLAGGAGLLALLIGAISVGGLFLIVPVVVALVQTHTCFHIRERVQG